MTIFGSSRPGETEPEYELALQLGRALAEAGYAICNGGYGGTMEASARGAREAHGHTIGVTVRSFGRTVNPWIAEEMATDSLMERILKLIQTGDAYVVLKGSTGTLLELAAVWEFANKGFMRQKPILILGDFWEGVVQTLKGELDREGLENCTRFVERVDTPEACVLRLNELLR